MFRAEGGWREFGGGMFGMEGISVRLGVRSTKRESLALERWMDAGVAYELEADAWFE